MLKKKIYFDYQATTPCDARVLSAMYPYFMEEFGNPHSTTHDYGWTATDAVENARTQIANLIGAQSSEIIFTSGATESNNLAIQGVIQDGDIITSPIEHKCVLEVCRKLPNNVKYVKVNEDGIIDLQHLESLIDDKTRLISIMAANNEIGTIQPIKAIGELCKKYNIFFHTDAAQYLSSYSMNVKEDNIDLLSISSHKLYGPKGIGALYINKDKRIRLKPLFFGGGQEKGIRPGTLSPALCVGFGKACDIIKNENHNDRIFKMRDYLFNYLNDNLTHIYLNGSYEKRLPGNLNISFSAVEGESLMWGLSEYALSSGSACTSESLESSYALKAIGIKPELAHTSLRISIGRPTTKEDVILFGERVVYQVNRLRKMSPLWEMMQEGIELSSIHWGHGH